MSFFPSPCKEDIRARAAALGAYRTGFAAATAVSADAAAVYDCWIAAGHHGSMQYCERYADVRRDPRLLLDGAATVISCAFCYRQPPASGFLSHIASYAYGEDYHRVVKRALLQLGEYIMERYGGEVRALTDTAPMRERYWAVQAGIGFIGRNNQLIIPGAGSYFFLGELLWTGSVTADAPCSLSCRGCNACVEACPGAALDGRGGCDCRRCISYLTIEHRGDLPAGTDLHGHVYGCDVCQQVCPHNRETAPPNILFPADPDITVLTPEALSAMTPSHFRRLTSRSAMQRVTIAQLRRNLGSEEVRVKK